MYWRKGGKNGVFLTVQCEQLQAQPRPVAGSFQCDDHTAITIKIRKSCASSYLVVRQPTESCLFHLSLPSAFLFPFCLWTPAVSPGFWWATSSGMFGPGPVSPCPWTHCTISVDPSKGHGTMFPALLAWEGQTAEYKLLKRSVRKKTFANLDCLCPCSNVLPLENLRSV